MVRYLIVVVTIIIGTTKCAKVKIDFVATNPEKSNLNFQMPISAVATILEGQKQTTLHLALKRALGTTWGDYKINWKIILKETRANKKTNEYESPDMYQYYVSDEDDEQYGKACDAGVGPMAAEGTIGVICGNCHHHNNYNAEKCSRCGEILESGFYFA